MKRERENKCWNLWLRTLKVFWPSKFQGKEDERRKGLPSSPSVIRGTVSRIDIHFGNVKKEKRKTKEIAKLEGFLSVEPIETAPLSNAFDF